MREERELVVMLENKPGNLAKIGEALRERKVNINALFASEQKGRGGVHMIVDKFDDAKKALQSEGFETKEQSVVIVELDNRPGTLGEIGEKLAKGGVNIDYAYFSAMSGQKQAFVVLGVVEVAKAWSLLK